MAIQRKQVQFQASRSSGSVSGLLMRPDKATMLLLFAHGAGAPLEHPFMESVSALLAERRIATFRYNFPYMEQGSKRPDPKPILLSTVRAALANAHLLAPDLRLIAGGKSMGGRMTSTAASVEPLENVEGLVFFGFPLHAPGKDSAERADHLDLVRPPMLFLQGTRDSLANLDLLRPVCRKLGTRATLHVIDGADHSFHVPKKSGRDDESVKEEMADVVAEWSRSL